MENPSAEIIGIIFPLPSEYTRRLLEDGKKVFVKFYGKNTMPGRLKAGLKLFLYESGGKRTIVGEAKIDELTSGTAAEVWSKFKSNLFLNKPEFENYVGERKQRFLLVLVVKNALRYAVPLKLKKPITMAGQYMTKQMFDALIRESNTTT